MKEKPENEAPTGASITNASSATTYTSTSLEVPRPQKVLLVITKSNFGGAQRYVFELATRLMSDGYEVAVALGGEGALKDKLINASIKVFPLSDAQRDINIKKEIRVLWRIFKIAREWRPDVMHLNSPKIGGLGVVAGKLAGVKKIFYTNHGWPVGE